MTDIPLVTDRLTLINNNVALIYPETSLLFTPQMIALEQQIGGVSFTKGCYVGQEIVARTQHLGKLKRHLHHLTFNTNSATNLLHAGSELHDADGACVGIVCDTALDNNVTHVLAVIEDGATISSPA